MACGTPAIAMRRGAMPELIRDGETGFLVDSLEEAVKRVRQLDSIRRRQCRRWVQERFTQERMVREYLRVYESILGRRRGI
jgi:glycosyltransferase involved in cell wall biosynthesis